MAPHGLAEEIGTCLAADCWHGARCAHMHTLPDCRAAVPLASCGCRIKDLMVLQLMGWECGLSPGLQDLGCGCWCVPVSPARSAGASEMFCCLWRV